MQKSNYPMKKAIEIVRDKMQTRKLLDICQNMKSSKINLNNNSNFLVKEDSPAPKENDCKLDSDLINRADAINCIKWGEGVTDVIGRIKALPSADRDAFGDTKICQECQEAHDRILLNTVRRLETPAGHWIDHKMPGYGYDPRRRYECSNCGAPMSETAFNEIRFNFCPACGKNMEGIKE